jgi:hypothetical protein
MTEQQRSSPVGPGHRDRSLGLAVFGVIEILLGILGLLLVPATLVATAATRSLGGAGATPDWRTVGPGLVVYTLLGVALIWLGVGSVRARRWARALLLALSWLWLITGALALLMSWWLLPGIWMSIAGLGDWPRGAMLLVEIGTALLLSVVYVALPAAFVLFYRSEGVIATCRARDPEPSIIADSPPQLLALAVAFALGALSVLLMPAYGFLLPVFGLVLQGAAGAVGWAGILLLLLWLTWRTLVGDRRAWWAAVVATILAGVSSTVTALVVPVADLLAAMRLDPRALQLLEGMGTPSAAALGLLNALGWATLLAYLVYARRWFEGRRTTG